MFCCYKMCRLSFAKLKDPDHLWGDWDFFFNKLEIKNTLSAIGIDDSSFQKMADKACGVNGFINGWKKLYPQDVYKIYKNSL